SLAVGVLFGLSLILFAISSVARARARAKSNAAYDSFEVSGTRDYTAPPTETPAETAAEATPEGAKEPGEAAEPITLPHEKYLAQKGEAAKGDTAPVAPPPASDDGGSSYRLTREDSQPAGKLDDSDADSEPRKRRATRRKDGDE
ncbi:MAG: hypothetical protein PHP07_00590, partial [Eubacteriales bacterium]|nr:hypothetical protein [Eubacteriales bacterium]